MILRLAMVSNEYPPFLGGISSNLQATAQALAQQGAEIHIITRQWDATAPDVSHEVEGDGLIVHRLATSKQRWQASPAFIWWSANLVRRLQPAVIHAHELLLPTTTALIAKRLTGRPVVVTVHTSGEMGDCVRLRRAAMGARRMEYVRSAVDRFVTISSVVAADMAAVGIPPQKRVVIPNGVDMERFQPIGADEKARLRRKLGLPDGTLVVFTGRLSPEKRVLPLAQQWPSLRQTYPDATLVLVGDGPEMAALRSLASTRSLARRPPGRCRAVPAGCRPVCDAFCIGRLLTFYPRSSGLWAAYGGNDSGGYPGHGHGRHDWQACCSR